MTARPPRPMPVPTPTSQPYWDALAAHRVRIQYSPSLGEYVFYPRVISPHTLVDDLEWREISGMGRLYTFTVAERPVSPHFADDVPQLLAVVQWDEGPRCTTEIVDATVHDLEVGMRMEPVFCDYPQHAITMLRYRPAR